MKPTAKDIAEFIEEASLIAENPAIIPGIDAEAAAQVRRISRITLALADQLADAQRNAAQAVARVRELEGEVQRLQTELAQVERETSW